MTKKYIYEDRKRGTEDMRKGRLEERNNGNEGKRKRKTKKRQRR